MASPATIGTTARRPGAHSSRPDRASSSWRPRSIIIGGLGLLTATGPLAAAPAPTPPARLMGSGEACAVRAGRAPDCVRDVAGGLVAYFDDRDARVAFWRTTAGRLGFVSPSGPEAKRAVFAVLAVGDLAWPENRGPNQVIPGDRGLILEIDGRTGRISGLGGTRKSLTKLGPGHRLS